MEPPAAFDDKAVRDEKVKVLRALRAIADGDVARSAVRGQYASGFIQGAAVHGYREEPGIAPASKTETYVALRSFVDNWREAGTWGPAEAEALIERDGREWRKA